MNFVFFEFRTSLRLKKCILYYIKILLKVGDGLCYRGGSSIQYCIICIEMYFTFAYIKTNIIYIQTKKTYGPKRT